MLSIAVLIVAAGVLLQVLWGLTTVLLICIGLGAVIAAVKIFSTRADCLLISETAITGKTGWIHSRKLVSPISRVQDVAVSSGLMGKILGYHNIIVSTAGTSRKEYVFIRFTHGKEFQEKFVELANRETPVGSYDD